MTDATSIKVRIWDTVLKFQEMRIGAPLNVTIIEFKRQMCQITGISYGNHSSNILASLGGKLFETKDTESSNGQCLCLPVQLRACRIAKVDNNTVYFYHYGQADGVRKLVATKIENIDFEKTAVNEFKQHVEEVCTVSVFSVLFCFVYPCTCLPVLLVWSIFGVHFFLFVLFYFHFYLVSFLLFLLVLDINEGSMVIYKS